MWWGKHEWAMMTTNQEFTFVGAVVAKALWRIAETATLPGKLTNKCCRDLRRRRIHQKHDSLGGPLG